VLGHPRLQLTAGQPNLVEGRELNAPQGAAVDTSANPPILYVADTLNNRVLGWRDANAFVNGAPADIVLGQRDKYSTLVLGPGTSLTSGLATPTAVAVDARGNLYVADAGNNRVIRYPQPFSQPEDARLADLVIGQTNLNSRQPNAGGISERTLVLAISAGPFVVGMAFDAQGNLWVTDAGNNRVLRYPAAALGEGASNGPAATLVLGQPDFRTNTGLPSTTDIRNRGNKAGMRQPSSVALDQGGRLYVAEGRSRPEWRPRG
jgi:sugar lactone lactonase YvrE